MSAVAVLDCTPAGTPMPDSTAVNRLLTLCAINWRKLAPKTRRMPVRTKWVPQISSDTAANRFKRCFMKNRCFFFLCPPKRACAMHCADASVKAGARAGKRFHSFLCP